MTMTDTISPMPRGWRPHQVRDEGESFLALHDAVGPEGNFSLSLRALKGLDESMTEDIKTAVAMSIWQGAEMVRIGRSSDVIIPMQAAKL